MQSSPRTYLTLFITLVALLTCTVVQAQKSRADYLSKEIEAAKKTRDYDKIIASKLALFQHHDSLNNWDELLPLCKDLLADERFKNTPESLEVMTELVGCYIETQDYSNIVELIEEIQDREKKLGKSPEYIQKQYHNYLATMHYRLKNYGDAAKNYQQSLSFTTNLNPSSHASILNNIGLCFLKNKQLDSAQYYFDQALGRIKKSGYPTDYSYHFENVVQANKATILTEKGQYAAALPYYLQELRYCSQYREYHIVYGAYYHIAETYYYLKQPAKALQYIDSFENYGYSQPYINTKIEVNRLKGKCLLILGKVDEANKSFKYAQMLYDSSEVRRQKEVFLKAVSQNESKKKDIELALSNQQIAIGQQTSFFQRIALGVLICSLLALLLFYRRTRQDKHTIDIQKQSVEKSLKEKETLLKEIHHRIKNNLQMVSGLLDIQAIKMDDPRFEEVITDSQRYINSMALVHQMLYQTHNASTVSIDRYLTDLTSETLRGLGDNNLKPTLRLDPQEFRLEQSIPLGLILCELITNTYKHAYPDKEGEIHIHLTQHGELFTFKYKDFGKGLPTDETETTTGVGQNLITLFAEEIGATLHIQNTNGLEYSFTFSKA